MIAKGGGCFGGRKVISFSALNILFFQEEVTNQGNGELEKVNKLVQEFLQVCFNYLLYQRNLRWILKKLFCLAASPKSVMVATNSAQNFDLEDLLARKLTHIYQMSIGTSKKEVFMIFSRLPRFLNQRP